MKRLEDSSVRESSRNAFEEYKGKLSDKDTFYWLQAFAKEFADSRGIDSHALDENGYAKLVSTVNMFFGFNPHPRGVSTLDRQLCAYQYFGERSDPSSRTIMASYMDCKGPTFFTASVLDKVLGSSVKTTILSEDGYHPSLLVEHNKTARLINFSLTLERRILSPEDIFLRGGEYFIGVPMSSSLGSVREVDPSAIAGYKKRARTLDMLFGLNAIKRMDEGFLRK